MVTFIAFALTIAGCINWLLIGLLQYDFVAGIFGFQGSIFSRLIYILIGSAAVFLVVKLIMDKGSIHIWGAQKKLAKQLASSMNIEASKEEKRHNYDKEERRKEESGFREQGEFNEKEDNSSKDPTLFDEHLDRR